MQNHADIQALQTTLASAYTKQRLAQALLFVGEPRLQIEDFVINFIKLLFCRAEQSQPCDLCSDCLMINAKAHPDLTLITKDAESSAIKIDQIRELQTHALDMPNRSKLRFIVLNFAQSLNTAAANALLKILEEPGSQTHFILTVSQIGLMPATILSRCQIWRWPNQVTNNYLEIAQDDIHWLEKKTIVLQALCSLVEEKALPISVAQSLQDLPLATVLRWLYLIYAELIRIQLTPTLTSDTSLSLLATQLPARLLFEQLTKINTIQMQLTKHVTVNQQLALEDLLFGLK